MGEPLKIAAIITGRLYSPLLKTCQE